MNTIIHGALLVVCFTTLIKVQAQENDWIAYKDELYIKSFTNLETYEGAKEFCSSLGDQFSGASLVMVKESDLQNLLTNYTQDIYDNIWLGGKYDEESAQFSWEDGEPLTYTNWQHGFPRNITNEDVCIELRPHDARLPTKLEGEWANVSCRKRNLVLCQKRVPWTLENAVSEVIKNRKQIENVSKNLEDAITEIIENRKQIEEGNKNLQDAVSQIIQSQKEMEEMSSRILPVGSIYVEYSGQPSPSTLWPTLTWEDITSTYAGLFFRAYGGGSEEWGVTQAECAPRISQMQYLAQDSVSNPKPQNPQNLASHGWSEYGYAGQIFNQGDLWYELLRFYTESCEVRPRNQAIRMWKRIA